ncbi:MAG: CRISPR-associated endonuclease Cas1 [Merismopedia sp. SIO2A8]|nr:CRISPR-associated endonuclease Cas1 [Symploca sp. SIO2B6]NET51802.1 CRISPR-associated endonuclease Cas1 [Merismopedia sp. SIO2A8]
MVLLYLTQQGSKLRKAQSRFLVEHSENLLDQENVEVPIREIENICVFGNIQLSTSVISSCLYHQIPVVFLSQNGKYKGHLWSAECGQEQIKYVQHDRFSDTHFQMSMAQSIVLGKLWNSRQFLMKLNRRSQVDTVEKAIAGLQKDWRAVQKLELTTRNLDRLRGYEGTAATRYFGALGKLLKSPEFEFTRRTRRPPTDPVNSLLSFGYTLLFNNVLSLLRVEGLNPYLGNLHRSDRWEAQLAFDLMEEFRSPIVDTLVVQLVNQRVFSREDFTEPNENGGVYLQNHARKRFLQGFEQRIMSPVKHPDSKNRVPYRQVIVLQIRRYRACLQADVLSETRYESFQRAT